MPHVHGIAWMDFDGKDEDNYLNADKTFNTAKILKLIDKWISCKLPTDDENLRSLVKELNVHVHTDSCKRKNIECRFDFPKLPSKQTLVAEPLPVD